MFTCLLITSRHFFSIIRICYVLFLFLLHIDMHHKNMTIISRAVLGYCYMLWFYSCNWYASQIHDNCMSCIFHLLIVISIIWKSGNNYIIDGHTKYEAKSARDGAWYGDSCTWPSYILLFDWLPNITRFSVFKKVTGDVVVYIHVFLIAHLISGRTTHT